jgi:drug/metabolite transporter (DMT)-like permease
MTSRATRTEWLLFATLGFAWGSSYLWIKIGVETLPPFTLIAARLVIAALLLGVVLRLTGLTLPRDRRVYGHLLVMAIVNIALPFFLIAWGEQSIDSALASILNSTVPLFTIVLAALALHDEAITVNRLVGLVLGFGGVVLLTSRNLAGAGDSSLWGELAIVGSSISYAAGAVYARRNVRGLSPMIPAFFQVFFALVITGSLALLLERPWALSLAPDAGAAILWLGLLGSGLAYPIFFRLLRSWGPTRTSLVAYVLPVVGILLGVIVLRESVDARVLGGTALIVGGVALVNSRFGARRLFGRTAPAADAEAPAVAPAESDPA